MKAIVKALVICAFAMVTLSTACASVAEYSSIPYARGINNADHTQADSLIVSTGETDHQSIGFLSKTSDTYTPVISFDGYSSNPGVRACTVDEDGYIYFSLGRRMHDYPWQSMDGIWKYNSLSRDVINFDTNMAAFTKICDADTLVLHTYRDLMYFAEDDDIFAFDATGTIYTIVRNCPHAIEGGIADFVLFDGVLDDTIAGTDSNMIVTTYAYDYDYSARTSYIYFYNGTWNLIDSISMPSSIYDMTQTAVSGTMIDDENNIYYAMSKWSHRNSPPAWIEYVGYVYKREWNPSGHWWTARHLIEEYTLHIDPLYWISDATLYSPGLCLDLLDPVLYVTYTRPTVSVKTFTSYSRGITYTESGGSRLAAHGYVYDLTNASYLAVIPTTSVVFSQPPSYWNDTSDSNGLYALYGFAKGVITDVSGTKSGYTHNNYQYTPQKTETHLINIYMIPNSTLDAITSSNRTILGQIFENPYHKGVDNSTVCLHNTSNTSEVYTTTSALHGYYKFENLDNGTIYSLNATKTGYTVEDGMNVSINASNYSIQDYGMSPFLHIAVTAKDATDSVKIHAFDATLSDGQNESTITGEIVFANITYGFFTTTVNSLGYYSNQRYVWVESSQDIEILLQKKASEYYDPTTVRFILTSVLGTRYANVATTVYKYGEDEEYLNGTTGTDGVVSFSRNAMSSSKKYTIHFKNSTQSIEKTVQLYPTDTVYYIILNIGGKWSDYDDRPMDSIHIAVTKSIINATHAYINVSYRDDTSGTLQLVAWVNETNPNDPRHPTNIASHTFSGDLNNTNHSFIVENYKGHGYHVRVWHEHNQFGTFYDRSIRFAGMLLDLGLPTAFYLWISVGMLFFVACMFGATNTSVGSIVVCALGWVFLAIGWLVALGIFAPISLTLASVYAVANNLITRHHRGGFA